MNDPKNVLAAVILSLSVPFAAQAANNQNVNHYPYAHIENSTSMHIKGKVHYASTFCHDDNYVIAPHSSWTASSRGVCLITKVEATNIDTGQSGDSYNSSGTSYSQFVVYQDSDGNPSVTRKIS